jgi:hypothetical protein
MPDPCHPASGRSFTCACGKWHQWAVDASIQVCHDCRRVHRRGKGGPKKSSKKCKGTGETINFSTAAQMARHDFMRTMFILGFSQNRDGRVTLTNHNGTKSKLRGFTVQITEHFGGDGTL